jgi:hypothetical protein
MLPPLDNPAEADARAAELDARLDALRVEDLNDALTVLRGWQGEISELRAPGLEFAIGVLLSVRDDHDPASKDEAAGAPDLHDTVFRAVGNARGPLMPLPVEVQRLLAEHVTNAVAPLVPYREVWDSSFPPGGRVCNICGQPVESEPCPDHAPDFYRPGYVYSYPRYADGYDWKFRCDAITTHPEDGERTALGWRFFKGEWGECAYGEDDWDIHNCDPAGDLIATPVEEVAR